jgi:hypothetical protein
MPILKTNVKQSPKVMSKKLMALLRKYGRQKDLVLKKGYLSTKTSTASKASREKPSLQLFGKKEVSVLGRKPKQTYIAGVIEQKHFAGFYHMPMYSHTKKFRFSPAIKKMLKGKSCINVNNLDHIILKELDQLIKDGISLYRQKGWV